MPVEAGSMVGVAQLVRAPDCGSGGRRFNSGRPPSKGQRRQALTPGDAGRVTGQTGVDRLL